MERWGAWVVRHRTLVVCVCLLLAAIAIPGAWHAVRHLDADISNQVSDRLIRFRTLRELNGEFGGDLLAAVIHLSKEDALQPGAGQALCSFGELLVKELSAIAGTPEDLAQGLPAGPWLQQVECRAGENFRKALEAIVKEHPQAVLEQDDVERMRALFEPDRLTRRLKDVRAQYAALDPAFSAERRRLLADPLNLAGLAEEALQRRLNAHRRSMGLANDEGFFLSSDGTTLIVLARPVRSGQDLPFCRALMAACQEAENRAIEAFRKTPGGARLRTSLKGERYGRLAPHELPDPQLRVGYTGMHAIAVENEASMRWDVLNTTATSAVAVLLVFLIAFHSLRLAWQIAATMGLAVLLTLAVAALLNGKIGVLGAGFTCILLGMGVDYGVHLHGAFHALRNRGREPGAAVREALARCGPGVLAASLTTVVAFGGIATTHFRGLAELGLLACLGLVFAALAMLTLFPALLVRGATEETQAGSRRDAALQVLLTLFCAGLGLRYGGVEDDWRGALPAAGVGWVAGAVVALGIGRIEALRRVLLPVLVCAAAGLLFGEGPGAAVGAALGLMAAGVHGCIGGLASLFQLGFFRRAAFLGGVLFVLVSLWIIRSAPEMTAGEEELLGVRFDAELGNIRSLRVLAIGLRQRIVQSFGQGFSDVRVVVEADSEDRAFAAAERIRERLAPKLQAGEIAPGGGLLQMIPSVRRQDETLASLRALDFQAFRARFLAAAEAEFGERAPLAFRDFLQRFDEFARRVQTAQRLSLDEILTGPIGPLASTFARMDRLDGRPRVRLVSYYRPRPDFGEAWYADLAERIEADPLPGTSVRCTAAQMVGFELKNSLILSMEWISSAVLILVVGWLVANFLSQGILIAAVNAGVPEARLLARAAHWGVLLFAGATALTHLGIGKEMVLVAFGITFGGLIFALALAFGLGGRGIARELLERRLRRERSPERERLTHL